MIKIQRFQRTIKQLCFACTPRIHLLSLQNYSIKGNSNENTISKNEQDVDVGKLESINFEQSLELSQDNDENENISIISKHSTFTSLLRYSKFIDLGDPENKVVQGKIFHVVDNDLYIDFGWKFHCVCSKPKQNSIKYVRGAKVKLRIKNLELSTRFLGATSDLTILEADCVLLSLIDSPLNKK